MLKLKRYFSFEDFIMPFQIGRFSQRLNSLFLQQMQSYQPLGSIHVKMTQDVPRTFSPSEFPSSQRENAQHLRHSFSASTQDNSSSNLNSHFSSATSLLSSYKSNTSDISQSQSNLNVLHEASLKGYKTKLRTISDKHTSTNPNIINAELDNKTLDEIKEIIIEKIKEEKNVSTAQAKKIMKGELLENLECQDWKIIETKIEVVDADGKKSSFDNKLIPASDMKIKIKNDEFSIFATEYKNQSGVSCYSNNIEVKHAANLWETKLQDKNGSELFKGIRHASLSSPNLNKQERAESAKNKVDEVIRAALFSKYESEITNILRDNIQTTKPFDLKISSTSLLTLFDFHLGNVNETEKTQFFDQMNAFKKAEKNLKEIEIRGIKIPVNIDFIQFSTGINNMALGSSVIMKALNTWGWSQADKINEEGLIKLMGDFKMGSEISGWTGEYLKKQGVDENKKNKIEFLVNEIREIFTKQKHHTENIDRFALPKRLLLLSYLIEATPAFNCKSGKDRTGMIDSEVKALAAKLSMQKSDSEISTTLDKTSLLPFYFDTANFEIQSRNSGLTGNKVMNSNSPLLKKLLTPEQYDLMKGHCNDG